jgi:hypothetical protein
VPCCDVIRIRGDKLCEQRAYLDQTAVWADLNTGQTKFKARWNDDVGSARRELGLSAEFSV